MNWKDFLYFSKGERRGLIILLSIIAIATFLLINKRLSNQRALIEKELVMIQPANNDSITLSKETENKEKPTSNFKPQTSNSQTKETQKKQEETKESVAERASRIISSSRPQYQRTEKFEAGTIVELNTADTTTLKKVPGIGSSFAKRITGYRNLLGGYYSVTQLTEVYGMDADRYNSLVGWFSADPSHIKTLNVNVLPLDSLRRHPYVSYEQAKLIVQLRRQKGKLTGWENLELLSEFTEIDRIKLQHYFSFE
jgi:DNA uptake protein ComE-like DNA-binding protein